MVPSGGAEFMGGGGGQRTQGAQAGLLFEHGLGGGQGLLHARRFQRRLPGIAGGEGDADDDGGQEAEAVHDRQDEGLARLPRQVERPEGQRHADRHGDQHHRRAMAGRQVGGGDGSRRHQHQAERIVEAAGDAEQGAQLDRVEAEL
ncbi:MAG: hypothetical protein WDN06_01250 [Asticcacaulis sp.]